MKTDQELKRAAIQAVGEAALQEVESGNKVSSGKLNKAFNQVVRQNKETVRKASAQEEQNVRDFTVATSKLWNRQRQTALREQTQNPAAPQKTASQKRDEAQQLYDAYVQSDEYKKKQEDRKTYAWMVASVNGDKGYVPEQEKDQKEQELKALVDHYTAQMKQEERQQIVDADLQELEGWDEQDRAALESYIINRNMDFANRLNPMADAGFGTADQKAAALIQKYGLGKVRQMAESLELTMNEEATQAAAKAGREGADSGFLGAVGHNAASVGANAVSGITGMVESVRELGNRTGRFDTLDPNNIGNLPAVYAGAVREETAKNISGDVYDENGNLIQDGGKLRQLGAYAYQGGMSAADSLARAALGGGAAGGAALAATGSFTQALSEASAQGATPAEAAALATVTAGIEYLSEKIPLDNLVDAAKAGGHSAKEIVKNALLQGGIEASTEEISLIGTTLAEAAILKEKAGYQQRIQELVAGGTPLADAQKAAMQELVQEAVDTAVVSFLSGGMSEAGASIAGNLAHRGGDLNADGQQKQAVGDNPEATEEQVPELTEQEKTDRAMEETAAEWGQDMPQEVKPEKTEVEKQLDQGFTEAMGIEQQKNTVPEETAVTVRSAGTALTEQNKEKNTLAYTLASNLDSIRDMDSVSQLTGKEFNDRSKKMPEQIREFFKSLGNKVARAGFGDVSLGEYGIGGMMNHRPLNRSKMVSLAAVPDVIKNGRQIAYEPNWKGRGYETYTFAAPVTVNGTEVYVAAVVNRKPDNKFYLSEMVDSEGNYVRIEESPSGNSKYGVTDGADNSGKAGMPMGPEGLSEGSNLSTKAEPMPLPENIVPQQKEEVNGNIDESRAQGVQPGIKGTGAAEANFSGKEAYNATLSEDNRQADRRDDVRPMELPAQDVDGNDVSAVTGNVYGSKITPDALASLMEEPTARGDFSYVKITNDQATQRATETIARSKTWEMAYDSWKQSVTVGNAGAEMSARGALFLNHAAQQGDKRLWLETLHYMQELGTNTAQGLQAFRIIRTLSAPDKIEFTRMTVQKMVEDIKLGTDIEIDEGLLNRFEQAKTDQERDEIMTEIQQNVADQIPSTFLDKFTALRYMNMLGNLKTTLVRNTLGNAAMKGVYKIKDSVAAGVEALLHQASGGKFQKTKSLTVSSELREACKADFAQYAGIVSDGGKFGDRQSGGSDFAKGVMDKRRIFKGDVNTKNEKFNAGANKVIDTVLTPMEWYRKGTNWAMNNKYFGDEAFGRGAYARAMAGYLKANGVKDADLSKVDDALLDKARAYAIQEAQEATFHDNTALARITQKGQKTFGIVGEGTMPFTKTPANILVRAEEFSPLGLINSTVKTIKAAKKGSEITGADIVNSWAKTFTGTALFALGAIMKDQGWLTASADDDEDKAAFDKLNGEQEYAIVLPDGTSYTMDWLGPSVMPMFMGAELAQAMEEAGGLDELTWADWENILTSVSDPMLQMSMLSGLNDSLDNIKYSDNSLAQLCINAAVSYLTQGLGNTLLGQMEKSTEEVRTQTYIDKDSQIPVWMQKQLGSLSQKIPLWDYQQTPYIDARGQEQAQPTGFGGWLYNLVSPGYLDKKEVDSVSEELYRLHETGATESNVFLDSPSTTFSYTDKDGVTHKDYNLTAEEADTLKRVTGQTSVEALKGLFESDTYKAMTDQQKTDALKYVDDYAREKGRTEAVEGYEGISDWMKSIDGNAAEAIINRTVEAAFSDAFSLADRDKAAAAEALDQAYSLLDPNGRLAWAQDAGSKEEAFIMAKARKIDTQTFTGLYQQYKDIGKDESLDNSQKAQEWADVLQKAQEAGDLTKAQKEGLKKDLIFYNQIPESSAKYDTMTNQGMDSDSADYIVGLLDGIEATADKLDKIAGAKLPEEQKDIAMKAWMDDYDPKAKKPNYTEVKYDYIRKELGYSATEYSAAKRLYSSDGTKEAKIDRIEDKLGITDAQARELYGILDGNKNAMLKDWAEELYG